MLKYFILIFIGAGLWACSSVSKISVDSETTPVTFQGNAPNSIDSIVAPYKSELEAEMNEVIAHADQDFLKGRPGGSLNNWAADATLQSQIRNARLKGPTFCLLNVGGLRNTINKGDVTLADIFKVMPFDNEIIWVELPVASLQKIEKYLIASGGEPIAGARLKNGRLEVDGVDENTKTVWVITSDYLFNGGDNMSFFEDNIGSSSTTILLRDAFIEEAKIQGTLIWNDENRIEL